MSDLMVAQKRFMEDLAELLSYIKDSKDFYVTGGELFRPYPQQLLYYSGKTIVKDREELVIVPDRKKSWTMSSKHLQRLAIDLNFFKKVGDKYILTYDKEDIQEFGDFWESLHPNNKWGGNWKHKDTPHFQTLVG